MGGLPSSLRGSSAMLAQIVLLLASFQLTLQDNFENGKDAISAGRANAETRLNESLAEVDPSVLLVPLKELQEISQWGVEDLNSIRSFEGPGDKDVAIEASIRFWKERMTKAIDPYVTSPENYKGIVFSDESPLPDPTWNKTEAYREVEREINLEVDEAINNLRKEHKNLTKDGPRSLEEVTPATWRRAGLWKALEAAEESIKRQGQRSKQDAANGNTEKAFNWLRINIESAISNFRSNVIDINSSRISH